MSWFCKGICCPHYDEEPERIPYVKKMLEDKNIDKCIAIEGYCALHLINDKPRFSVSFKNETNSHHVVCNNNEIIHNDLPNVENIIMKIANTLSILLATVLAIISAQWIFSPESVPNL